MKKALYLLMVGIVVVSVEGAEKANKQKKPPKVSPEMLKLYEPSEFKGLPYRLMKPIDFDASKTYPLVLSLHGAGGKGSDNLSSLKVWTEFLADESLRRKHPAFVLVPQSPGSWMISGKPVVPDKQTLENLPAVWDKFKDRMVDAAPVENGSLSLAFELVEKLCGEYKIDRSRIYVLGHSMGGFGSWTAIWYRPDFFAAAIPCAGGLPPWYDYSKFKDVPVWTFHSADDPVVSVEYTRAIFQALQKCGGNMKYTELNGVGHGAQTPAFSYKGDQASGFTTQCASPRCDKTEDVWDWLFSQKR
jgi:predicted peptidase